MRVENAGGGYPPAIPPPRQQGQQQIPDLGPRSIACATHAACAGPGGRDPRPGTFPSLSFLSLGPPPLFQGGAQLLHYGHAVPNADPLGNAGLGLPVGRFIGCLRSEGIDLVQHAGHGLPFLSNVQPTPGSQLALFASYSYHGFITDRDGDTLELEADHRRHAEVENAIRDLKYGVGLNHLPSGRFAANAAWLAVQVLAHNLARWAARIGLGEQLVTTKTLRRRFFSMAGRLTRSARRLTLHLPQGWPWAEQATLALARLRAIPLPA